MKLDGKRILLTGAAGGIGALLAEALIRRGARVALVDRNGEALAALAERLATHGGIGHAIPADLLDTPRLGEVVERARRALGGLDLLINVAGLLSFSPLEEEDPAVLERIVRLNLTTPLLLTREALPHLRAGGGRVVNIGSTFGAIGFAWFAAYSASKFGLRGLSEALRRELDGSGVGVTYVAPRAVRTKLNTGAIYRMADRVGMSMDEPEWVAQRIVAAIEGDAKEVHLGFPEKLFARINGLLPRLVDAALRKQNRAMEPFAREA
jgi:short-subunit dehydrogenase